MHYMIGIDWACLGPQRSQVMRQALSLEEEPDTGAPGRVPSWLTAAHAEAVRGSPCVQDVTADLACWYCKPTPKSALQAAAEAELAAAAAEQAAAEPEAAVPVGSGR